MPSPCSSEVKVLVKHFSRGVWLINVIKKERKPRFHEISLALFYRTRDRERLQDNSIIWHLSFHPKKRPFVKWTKKLKNRVFALTSPENLKSVQSMTKPLKSNPTTIPRVIKKEFKKIKKNQTKVQPLKDSHTQNRRHRWKPAWKPCSRRKIWNCCHNRWSTIQGTWLEQNKVNLLRASRRKCTSSMGMSKRKVFGTSYDDRGIIK